MSTPTATQITVARLAAKEEGERLLPYDDETGLPVKAPVGALTWGIGFNLMTCGSHALFMVMLTFLVGEIEKQLQAYAWYRALPFGVQSACQDLAYNAGVHGLLHYPQMIAYLADKNWAGAASQCTTTNPKLQNRYKELQSLIAAGA